MAYIGNPAAPTLAQVSDNTITSAKIVDGAVTPSDLSTGHPNWDSSGNVGIGTTSPSDTQGFGKALDVQGSTGAAVYVGASADRATFGYASGELHVRNPNASGTTRFYVNNSEKLRILSSGGITFNGDTAAANALDDYEEGTWTPAYSAAAGTVTYSVQTGIYTKIGNTVFVSGLIAISAISGATGSQLFITGLPFMPSLPSGNHTFSGTIGRVTNWNSGATGAMFLGNQTYFEIYKESGTNNSTDSVGTDLTSTSTLRFNGIYTV